MRRPLVWITLYYMAGILAGKLLELPLTMVCIITGIGLLVALAGYWFKWPGNRYLIVIPIFCAGLLITGLYLATNKTNLTGEIGHQITIKGGCNSGTPAQGKLCSVPGKYKNS